MDRKRIAELAHKYLTGTASQVEAEELHRWYDEQDFSTDAVVVTEEPETTEALRARMLDKLLASIQEEQQPSASVIPLRSKRSSYWAAAAVAVGLFAGTIYFITRPGDNAASIASETRFKNDLPAGGNRAVLQLADGTTIVLDSALNGTLATQGTTSIIKTTDGQLAYNAGGAGDAVLYNSITTPTGGEYQVTLPDGSKVWLNAMSGLRFPAAFSGNERKVELNGEAYFEVAKNAAKPFKVGVGKPGTAAYNEVEVLGTHFNIHAYNDEAMVKTTLLEGKVKVTSGNQSVVMNPGEQVQIDQNGKLNLAKSADTEEVMAWHNGLFKFRELSIEEIMQQARRWYNIEVVYEGKITEHFVSTIPRQSTAVAFFNILEKTGRVQFTIDGNKVTVRSAK